MSERHESPNASHSAESDRRPRIMTLDEVAAYLRVHRSTVYRMAREGTIPSMKVANQWRFHKDRIDRWLFDSERALDPESTRDRATG